MAADDALTGVGELLFSLLIGYLGALEFAFVAQHLYHWTCRHPDTQQAVDDAADAEELPRLRDRLDKELAEAAAREAAAGSNVMQDGVLYSNGFRVESPEDKRKALAAELERQRQIEEETRKQLAEAEHKLAEERKKAEEERLAAEAAESERKLIEAEKQREAAQREREQNEREQKENERKLLEAEKQREAEQREREENERRMQEHEKKRREREEEEEQQRELEENARRMQEEEKQRREREENVRKLREAEQQRETEENERRLQEAEEERREKQRQRELAEEEAQAEAERRLLPAEEEQAKRDAEIVERLLAAERERKLSATESELEEEAIIMEQSRRLAASKTNLERKQKSIEENARLFMEAEEEMVMLHQRMLQAAQEEEATLYAGVEPVVEEPCIKKCASPRFEEPEAEEEPLIVQRVKTQLGQGSRGSEEPYMVKSKTLMFPGVSDEGSSVEPISSQQSSFSTQPSEERSHMPTADDERQEPEGEDNMPDVQYTEDYLRSLDGIKSRSLIREDGSGRRRAFKKRRSSGSSNSSRDSRASRDEELKMFTSLEEEELRHGDKADYNPIKYTTEPTLRVKSHHRRHKRSPAKDVKPSTDAAGSLEMLGEESTNPWGEVTPEHYKDSEFWKREKALSIDEENLDLEKRASGEEVVDMAQNQPKASSFEEATNEQNELAATALLQQRSKEKLDKDKDSSESSKATESTSSSDIKSNLQTSSATEEQQRQGSPGLRRSPRIDEMDHYEERWRQSEQQASHQPASPPPSISVQQPDTAPWRDQYGLMMEGLSDFYDFQASINPSRSRSTSRNPSPTPKNVANLMDVDEEHTLEVYDDTQDGLMAGELNCESVLNMLQTTMNGGSQGEQLQLQNVADDVQNGCSQMLSMVYESTEEHRRSRSRSRSPRQPQTIAELEQSIEQKEQLAIIHLQEHLSEGIQQQEQFSEDIQQQKHHSENLHMELDAQILPQPIIEINDMVDELMDNTEPIPTREEMRLFVETLRAERNSRSVSRSRSRSRSPLPTSDNIERSLETRRQKRIRQNDELAEKLQEEEKQRSQSPAVTPPLLLPPSLPTVPTISIEIAEELAPAAQEEKESEDTPESMARLFEQLRLNRCRSHSRSRSRSPLPSAANLEHSLQKRREKLIAQNDAFFEQLEERAKTPEPERRLTVEHRYEYVESSETEIIIEDRDMRSLSPSRSRSRSRSKSPCRSPSGSEEENSHQFHLMLNLEGSEARTLRQHSQELERVLASNSQELERVLASNSLELERVLASNTQEIERVLANAKQREVDLEALEKLHNASEEMEIRLMTPPQLEQSGDYERSFSEAARDLKDELLVSGFKRSTYVGESLDLEGSPSRNLDMDEAREQAAAQRELQATILNSLVTASGVEVTVSGVDPERLGARPKTSEYERSFSEEVKDTQRMKEESLAGGFKRSTYVGESLDMGISSQLDDLRHRTAEFQRSRSQSRSPLREGDAALKNIEAEAAKRELQDQLMDQLAASNFQSFSRYLNADFLDSERRASDSALIQLDPCADLEPEEYHHFRRYSLAQEQPVEEYPSDECVYISQIEVRSLTGKRTWLKEDFYTQDLGDLELNLNEERERKSEYLSEGSWARAVLAAEAEAAEFDETNAIYNYDIVGEYPVIDEFSSNDSDDERQTVVEIDDDDEYEFELDEGISDNNERTQPTDESHHDTSECEEAERNADRYANRNAKDWEDVENVDDLDDGAVGGTNSDPDSFIEQIYNDAVKNRKQSGILREYETMIQEQLNAENADQSESDKEKSSSDSERYALWAKTRELDRSEEHHRHHRDIDISIGLLESERRDAEMRYLGDAQGAARQSTRLRTRYGYSPQLQVGVVEDDIEVDLNYKPKREYNWRKNFKLDDNEPGNASEIPVDHGEDIPEGNPTEYGDEDQLFNQFEDQIEDQVIDQFEHLVKDNVEPEMQSEDQLQYDGESLDLRRFSLGGESITLFSRSPEREKLSDVPEEGLETGEANGQQLEPEEQIPPPEEQISEKPKKKKSKKKSRKGSKTEEELRDDNDSDNQQYNRRSSATRDDLESLTEAPKRKVRSRRSSKSSANNEELNGALFSPRSSIAFETLEGIAEFETPDETSVKKKTKKRKKISKESKEQTSMDQPEQDIDQALVAALSEIAPIKLSSASTNLTPASSQQHLLSSISVGHSLCLTPASSFDEPMSPPVAQNHETAVTPARSVVDTFDILKDANFYPLF